MLPKHAPERVRQVAGAIYPEAMADSLDRSDLAGPIVFFDGRCGLCHRWVEFVLPRDPDGRIRFAPQQGPTFERLVPQEQREHLPDSVFIMDREGTLVGRSDAALDVLAMLHRPWPALAQAARLVPRGLRDLIYDGVASVRHHFFSRPDTACPLVPVALRGRFLP